MHLQQLKNSIRSDTKGLLIAWNDNEEFFLTSEKGSKSSRRHVLAKIFSALCEDFSISSCELRAIWSRLAPPIHAGLPLVIEEDGFLRMYAEGMPLSYSLFCAIYDEAARCAKTDVAKAFIGGTEDHALYHDIKAVPAGIPPKFSSKILKKIDPTLIKYVQNDLRRASCIEDHEKRRLVTLALLSHGAAYRQLEGKILYIPSFKVAHKLVPYLFSEHLIWEGVKTISACPLEDEKIEKPLYLCQGTEIWPSQPLMLGSIFANLNQEGPATEPYAYAWRQIHKHLLAITKKTGQLPIVSGHSMGGALATQIALYSHPFIERAYAFNPPVVSARDYHVYNRLSPETKEKLYVFANIDDLPFWRLGSYVIGHLHILLGEKRSKYYPLNFKDRLLVIPGAIKVLLNICNMVPAHQDIVFLMKSYVVAKLKPEEIRIENRERRKRSGHIRFISKLYVVVRFILRMSRKYLRWEKKLDYLKSQLEIVELHILDLEETQLLSSNLHDIAQELDQLKKEQADLRSEIEKIS